MGARRVARGTPSCFLRPALSDLGTRDCPRGTLLLGYRMRYGPHPTSIVTTRNAVGFLVQQ
jgi:hypothetical protein